MKTLTLKEAAHQLRGLTRQERVRINAMLQHFNCRKAAAAIGCDEETVARTWKRYRHLLKPVIDSVESGEPGSVISDDR